LSIKNPFAKTNLRAFDLRGIVMGAGNTLKSQYEALVFAAPDGMRLENADGYTRWWNAVEFTTPGLFGYTPGVLGSKGFAPSMTLNPYKYFADVLGPKDQVTDKVNMSNRGTLSPGVTATRNYVIRFPFIDGKPVYKFQYAIDANWAPPSGANPKPEPIEDFPPNANCPEAYHVSVDASESSLYYVDDAHRGGVLRLAIEVFDWGIADDPFGTEQIARIYIESPTLFNGYISHPVTPLPGSQGTSEKFYITLPEMHPTGLECQEVMVTVGADWGESYAPPVQGPKSPYALNSAYALAPVTVQTSPSIGSGYLEWAKQSIGTYGAKTITPLSDDSTVVAGNYEGIATFGPGEPSQTVLDSSSCGAMFFARYKSDGSFAWAKSAGATEFDNVEEVEALSDDTFVATGVLETGTSSDCTGPTIFGLGEPNETVLDKSGPTSYYPYSFVARYNADGTLAWVKSMGHAENDILCQASTVTPLTDRSVVVAGYWSWQATFGEGEPNETVLTSVGTADTFIARYDSDGSLAWAKDAGSSSQAMFCGQIKALSDDSIVLLGTYIGTATFGKGEPNETALPVSKGSDIFIAKYNSDGTLAWAKNAGGAGDDFGNSLVQLLDSGIVIVGEFYGPATFGVGEPNETVLELAGDHGYLAKYNTDGALVWAKIAAFGSAPTWMTRLKDDSTVVTGLMGPDIFAEGEINQTAFPNVTDSYGVFIARNDPDGSLKWAKRVYNHNTGYYLYSWGIAALSDDSTVIAGGNAANGNATFGSYEPNETKLESNSSNMFVARYYP
jgi:hypothetical protein